MEIDLGERWLNACATKDRSPIHEWLEKYWTLSAPYTETGLFNVQKSRHLIAIFESFQREDKREINILAGTRAAKSLVADGCQQWVPSIRPGPSLFAFQDEKAIKDHAESRTWPNFLNNPEVAKLLSEDRHKNRALDIIFPHMIFHLRGPADSNFQSRGYQYVYLDEIWQYKGNKLGEAKGRLGDYAKKGTDKLMCLSQGGFIGDDWETQYNSGVIHEWHIQCLSCGHYMLPVWSGSRPDGSRWGMRWDEHKTPSGLWNIAKCLPSVRYECEACGHPHIWNGRTKTEWNRTGRYVAEETDNKLKTKDSFHWPSLIDSPWDKELDKYLEAVNAWKYGNPGLLIQFDQKRMAKFSSEESLLSNKLNVAKARYEIQTKAPEAVRVLSCDRQEEDEFWVTARDWFPPTEQAMTKTQRVWFGNCYSFEEIESKRIELGIEANRVIIDSGYKPKGDHGVYAACIKYGWLPAKGEALGDGEPKIYTRQIEGPDGKPRIIQSAFSDPTPADAMSGIGKEQVVEFIKFSSPTFAERVWGLIDKGLWIEPEGMEADPMEKEYKKQMTAEFKRPIQVGNKLAKRTKYVVVCPSKNNHAFDCAKMQALYATLLDFIPDLG